MLRIKLILAAIFLCQSTAFAQSEASRAVPHVVIVFDDSGSMDESLSTDGSITKLEAAKAALVTVLQQVDDNAKVGLYLLNGQYDESSGINNQWWIPLGKLNRAQAVKRIEELRTNGGTPLGSAMKGGCDALIESRKQDHYGSYRLLIVTDGEADYGSEVNLVESYTPDIMARGYITVDVIGVDMRGDHTLATKVHNYRNAADSGSLERAIQAVFAESSPNDKNSAEDYALTAALPEETAKQVIQSLSETGVHPVGEAPKLKTDQEGNIELDEEGNVVTEEGGGVSLGLICLFCFCGVFFLFILWIVAKIMMD